MYLVYAEPGPDDEPIIIRMHRDDAIAYQRQVASLARPGFQYESDEVALSDFISVHWAHVEPWSPAPDRQGSGVPGTAWATWDRGDRCFSVWWRNDQCIGVLWGRGEDKISPRYIELFRLDSNLMIWSWLDGRTSNETIIEIAKLLSPTSWPD